MIYISTVSRRGNSHPDQNEDSFWFKQTNSIIIGGVFDGCSTGTDSYFASKLFANCFRKTIEQLLEADLSVENFATITHAFINNLNTTFQTIGLSQNETLSTAILFHYDINSHHLNVRFFGDGVVYANNNQLIVFNNDEDNKPDYLSYKMSEILNKVNFDRYWSGKKDFCITTTDFSICSDGMFSFKCSPDLNLEETIPNYLVCDKFLYQNPSSLKRKLNILKNKGCAHFDDITIIRIINE